MMRFINCSWQLVIGVSIGFLSIFTSCKQLPPNHWEEIAHFTRNGSYTIVSSENPVDWNAIKKDESIWESQANLDTTRIEPHQKAIVRLSFDLSDSLPELFGGLFRAHYKVAFRAYLNGRLLVERRNNEFVPDYQHPLAENEAHGIYAFYRPVNFILKPEQIYPLILNNQTNEILIEVENAQTFEDLSDFSFSLGVVPTKKAFVSYLPSLSPDKRYHQKTLPVLHVQTGAQSILDEPKIDAQLTYEMKADSISMPRVGPLDIGIELRGNTAQQMSKKSFGINLKDCDNLKDFLGMPVSKKWILYGPYTDRTLLRNAYIFKLSELLGHYSTRFRFCELFINNSYQGLYILSEKIELAPNRISGQKASQFDGEPGDPVGDFLVEIDRGKREGLKSKRGHEINDGIHYYELEDPEFDELKTAQRDFVIGFLEQFEDQMLAARDSLHSRTYEHFIIPEKFYDYIILQELSKNIDAYRLSTFLVLRGDRDKGVLEPGPLWDFNLSFGLPNYKDAFKPEGFVYEIPDPNIPFWWIVLMRNEHFREGLQTRYTELRQTTLHRDSLQNVWNTLQSEVQPVVPDNFSRWPVLGWNDFWPNSHLGGTYQDGCDYLNKWLTKRIQWLDVQWLNEDDIAKSE